MKRLRIKAQLLSIEKRLREFHELDKKIRKSLSIDLISRRDASLCLQSIRLISDIVAIYSQSFLSASTINENVDIFFFQEEALVANNSRIFRYFASINDLCYYVSAACQS